MNSEKWNVEDRGKSSAAPDDLGILYRKAFDGLKDWEVPSDMTDRIMAGLKAEKGILPDVDAENVEGFSRFREQVVDLADRGKIIFAGFGKYAASVAACFVLALGMFTMNSPAGQQIIGIGTENGASVTSEAPVKADSGKMITGQRNKGTGSPEKRSKKNDSAGTEDFRSQTEPDEGADASGVTEPEFRYGELQNPSPAIAPTPEKKTVKPSGDSRNTTEGTSTNRSTENNGSGGSQTGSNHRSSTRTESSSSSDHTPQIVTETPPAAVENNTPAPAPEEVPDLPDASSGSSSVENELVRQEPEASEEKKPFIFDSTHPVKELDGVEQLTESLGYQPALPQNLPDGWTVSSVEVIWGVTAQVVYSNGENTVLFRTSAGVTSISSDSGTYPFQEDSGIYRLEGGEDRSVSLVTWTSGDYSYSMSFDAPVSRQEALEWAERVVLEKEPA